MSDSEQTLRGAGCVLLGAVVGTAFCLAVQQQPVEFAVMDGVSFASMTVFALLVHSLGIPDARVTIPY